MRSKIAIAHKLQTMNQYCSWENHASYCAGERMRLLLIWLTVLHTGSASLLSSLFPSTPALSSLLPPVLHRAPAPGRLDRAQYHRLLGLLSEVKGLVKQVTRCPGLRLAAQLHCTGSALSALANSRLKDDWR